ncbi:MAG: hypothetical protein ACRC8S_02465 [Fimbriiglobus sp.]
MAQQTPKRLADWEVLETREVPAASLLADLNTAGGSSFNPYGGNSGFTIEGKAVFIASDGATQGVYVSDGSAKGTTRIATVTADQKSYASDMMSTGSKGFFEVITNTMGTKLWVTDGTAAGTKPMNTELPGAYSGREAIVNGKYLFEETKHDHVTYNSTTTVRSTDGTTTTTLATLPSFMERFTVVGDRAFFLQRTFDQKTMEPVHTIWTTDATVSGTKAFMTLPSGVQLGSQMENNWAGWLNGKLYFAANDLTYDPDSGMTGHGEELWVSDGTEAGTKMLKDIATGTSTSWMPYSTPQIDSSNPEQFATLGNSVYFTAEDGVHGQELWVTDGTEDGTKRISQINTDGPMSNRFNVPGPLQNITVLDGKLYFTNFADGDITQLYTTNGETVTKLSNFSFAKAAPGANTVVGGAIEILGSSRGRVLFGQGIDEHGTTLWSTDGTPNGTKQVLTNGKPLSKVDLIANLGDRSLVVGNNGTTGIQLFSTDGTSAKLVTAINKGTQDSLAKEYVAVGNKAYFTAMASDGRSTVYVTDGKSAPNQVIRLEPRPTGFETTPSWLQQYADQLTVSNGKVFFISAVGSMGRQLWVTDGGAAKLLMQLDSVPTQDLVANYSGVQLGISNLTDAGSKLYFSIDAPGRGQQLYWTDGTRENTKLVTTMVSLAFGEGNPFNENRAVMPMMPMAGVNGKVYFASGNGLTGNQLWVSDGTAKGTVQLTNAGIGGGYFSNSLQTQPTDLTVVGNKVFFIANPVDGGGGGGLFYTEGTAAKTKFVTGVSVSTSNQLYPGNVSSMLRRVGMVAANGKVFFPGADTPYGIQLYSSDGTEEGTQRLTLLGDMSEWYGDMGEYSARNAQIAGLTTVGKQVYFSAFDRNQGRQLYVTDGTVGGTRVLTKLGDGKTVDGPFGGPPTGGGASPTPLAVVGNQFLFVADDGVNGREVWVTDGTTKGTRMAVELNKGQATSFPEMRVGEGFFATAAVLSDRVIFTATGDNRGSEPWSVPFTTLGIPAPTTPPVVPPTVTPRVISSFSVRAVENTLFTANLASVQLHANPNYRVRINWGAGILPSDGRITRLTPTGSSYTISGTGQLARLGANGVTVSVMSGTTTVLSFPVTVTVDDAPWTVAGRTVTTTLANPFTGVVATITDRNLTGGQASDYTASIKWSNGRTTTGTVRRKAHGEFEVTGTNRFTTSGRQTVSVTITSVAGRSASATSTFTLTGTPRK